MTREKWAASFGPDKELWKLAEQNDTAMFLTRDKPDGDPYGRFPVFHVWKSDKWLYCGHSREAADRIYAGAVEET